MDSEGEEGSERQQWPKAAVDRIQRYKRQRDQVRTELQALKSEVETLKARGGQPQQPAKEAEAEGPMHPDVAAEDPAKITARLEQAQNTLNVVEDLLDELAENPDGVAERLRAIPGIKLEEFTPSEMRKFLRGVRASERDVIQQAPRRIQFLKDEQAAIAKAVELMPELSDQQSPRFQAVQQVIQQYPALKQRPDWAYHATVYALGVEALQARQSKPAPAAAAKPAPKPIPAPPKVPGAARSQPSQSTGEEAKLEALRQKAQGPDGTRADRDAYTAALLKRGK